MNNKIKYLSFFFLMFFIIVHSQLNDTVFIKKDNNQRIYILQDKNLDSYKSLVNYSDFNINENIHKIKSLGLNSKWLSLHKYKSEYYLYIPCDEINDTKYVVDDSNLQIKSSEISSYAVSSIKRKRENVIIQYKKPHSKKKIVLTIIPVNKEKGIYKFVTIEKNLRYELLMLEANQYKNYKIIVNECVYNKVNEFEFDK